jgi:hypothetical protein
MQPQTKPTMKTFKDLTFTVHPNAYLRYGTQAEMNFDNGYGISVITGEAAYTSDNKPYEIAILFEGNLTYNTHITDDVIGHQDSKDVTRVMQQVQELKS